MESERFVPGDPQAVVGELLRRPERAGHVLGVERFGARIVFVLSEDIDPAEALVADVSPWHGGSLVQVERAVPHQSHLIDDDREFRRLLGLLGDVAQAQAARVPADADERGDGT